MAMVLPSGVIQAEDRGVIYSITWFSPPANYEKKGSKWVSIMIPNPAYLNL